MAQSIIEQRYPTREALERAIQELTPAGLARHLGVTQGALNKYIERQGWRIEVERRLVEAA